MVTGLHWAHNKMQRLFSDKRTEMIDSFTLSHEAVTTFKTDSSALRATAGGAPWDTRQDQYDKCGGPIGERIMVCVRMVQKQSDVWMKITRHFFLCCCGVVLLMSIDTSPIELVIKRAVHFFVQCCCLVASLVEMRWTKCANCARSSELPASEGYLSTTRSRFRRC